MKSKDERILMRELAGSPEEWCPSPARLRAASRASGKLRGNWEVAGQRGCPCRAGGGVVLSGTLLSPPNCPELGLLQGWGESGAAWGSVHVLWSRGHRAGPHKGPHVGQCWVIQGCLEF